MHRAINSLIGSEMAAIDGKVGKVNDFYFDDRVWVIVYLIVKTGNWLSGRKVLISPVKLIKGADRYGTFSVILTREQIVNGPDIHSDKPPRADTPKASKENAGSGGEPHLRSTHAITGYLIETPDGEPGHLRDLIIDEETWHIKYLVIEMQNCLEGKQVILPLKDVKEVRWSMSKMLVDITSDRLKDSPEFRESDYSYSETGDRPISMSADSFSE
jgi:sporulation protein YlmC with PRC-barrel domain